MLQKLIELERKFQPFLLGNDYTFIGPIDATQFEAFVQAANNLAPAVGFSRSIHHVLSNKQATWTALQSFLNSPLQVFVISATSPSILVHATIEDYCLTHNITFPPDPQTSSTQTIP